MYDVHWPIRTVHGLPYVNHTSRDPMTPTHTRARKEYLGLVAYE